MTGTFFGPARGGLVLVVEVVYGVVLALQLVILLLMLQLLSLVLPVLLRVLRLHGAANQMRLCPKLAGMSACQ